MLFNSVHFVVFFLVVLSLNQALRRWPTAQKLMLLAASYYFYGQWEWHYLLLIWFSTITDYLIALRLPRSARPRRLVVLSVVVNLGFLAIFKYANWMIDTFNMSADAIGSAWHITPIDLLLPVGISFYTFQSLSYTIDVYRGVLPPRRNLLDYSLAVAFFPQIEAGPIVRAREFLSELDGDRRLDFGDVRYALVLIALGYAKKLVFADNLAQFADPVFDSPALFGFWDCLLAIYAFAFQIYCDFSGYTDIAIGCALLLGIRFPRNFDYPYASASLQEFWRRWHMTLSRWLRDYLYIPLGGNRKGPAHTYFNLVLTMLLGGLWHGASWNFVIWGGIHGGWLALERATFGRFRWWGDDPGLAARFVRAILTFHVVCAAWVFFRAPDFAHAASMFRALSKPADAFDASRLGALLFTVCGMFLLQQAGLRLHYKERLAGRGGIGFVLCIAIAILAMILFAPAKTVPFIYFQF